MTQTLEAIFPNVISTGNDIHHAYICCEMLYELCCTPLEKRATMTVHVAKTLVGLRLEGVIDTLALGQKYVRGRRVRWSHKRIARAEEFLAKYEEEAVRSLQSILSINLGDNSQSLVRFLGLATTFLWGLHDAAVTATQAASTGTGVVVRRKTLPTPPPSNIA